MGGEVTQHSSESKRYETAPLTCLRSWDYTLITLIGFAANGSAGLGKPPLRRPIQKIVRAISVQGTIYLMTVTAAACTWMYILNCFKFLRGDNCMLLAHRP